MLKIEVDFKKIDKALDCFLKENHGRHPKYVITSHETVNKFNEWCISECNYLYDIPIAFCDVLEFGDIEFV